MRSPAPLLALAALLAASSAFAQAAPALLTLQAADVQINEILRIALEESLQRRVRALQEGLETARGSLGTLRLDASRLSQRADSARGRRVRDNFFAFDLARLRRDVWMKRLELDRRRWEADAIEREATPGRRLRRLLAQAEKESTRLEATLQELESETTYLASSVALTDASLLGGGARYDAARVRVETRQMALSAGMLQTALHDAGEKAAGGGSVREAPAR